MTEIMPEAMTIEEICAKSKELSPEEIKERTPINIDYLYDKTDIERAIIQEQQFPFVNQDFIDALKRRIQRLDELEKAPCFGESGDGFNAVVE